MTTKLSPYQQTLLAVIDACGRANPDKRQLTPGQLTNYAHKHMDGCLPTTPNFRSFHALGDKGKAWEVIHGAHWHSPSLCVAVNPHYGAPAPVEALFAPGQTVAASCPPSVYRVVATDKEGWVRVECANGVGAQLHQRHLYRVADATPLGRIRPPAPMPAPLTEEK